MDDILTSIGLGDGLTGTTYDLMDAGVSSPALPINTGVSTGAASSPGTTSSFWGALASDVQGLTTFASQAAPVATQVNNLVNSTQGKTAKNNTASATGSLASAASNPLVWIGLAIVGIVLAVFLFKK